MNRRQFIRLGSGGLAALALGSFGPVPYSFREPDYIGRRRLVGLSIREVLAEMIDLTRVPMWAFVDEQLGPRVPGPVVLSFQDDLITFEITNHTEREHAFAVQGITQTGIIPQGETLSLAFRAPQAGTYLYFDPLNAPVNRLMGLHGALIVLPRTGNTPYTRPPRRMQALFNDLGASERFPGDAWSPNRTWVWVLNTIDPLKNHWVQDQPAKTAPRPNDYMEGYLPKYFTINGKTGYFAAHDPQIMPSGKIGQPALIRVLNAGGATHSVHMHGNHVYLLAEEGKLRENVLNVDTWSMPPGSVKDVLLPFTRPPDIPPGAWPPSEESFPWHYVMHCHTQMSQTAAGANYPQGMNVHWTIVHGE